VFRTLGRNGKRNVARLDSVIHRRAGKSEDSGQVVGQPDLTGLWKGRPSLGPDAPQAELSLRISANIAEYLEPPGRGRHACFQKR
jgi:hypothetical protein